MIGITQTMDLYQTTDAPVRACFPATNVGNMQLVGIVINFLERNPKLLHMNEAQLAIFAFSEAFPCE